MNRSARQRAASWSQGLAAVPMVCVLALPVIALVVSSSPESVWSGFEDPAFNQALWLSARTSCISLLILVTLGTPLAWWLAVTNNSQRRAVELVVDLPIVLPPAVVGIALLQAFGRQGLLGELLASVQLQVPFTEVAVVLAQVTVASPFYIQGAAQAFRRIDPDLLIVSRSLGHSALGTFFRVTVPLALPGLVGSAALSWARALGEFGATLLFAGNLPGTTQTMPLAIYMALESNVDLALALSLALALLSVLLLFVLRWLPNLLSGSRHGYSAEPSKEVER
jgi:molybdate transport system permease protein